jgi:hypothetical protein
VDTFTFLLRLRNDTMAIVGNDKDECGILLLRLTSGSFHIICVKVLAIMRHYLPSNFLIPMSNVKMDEESRLTDLDYGRR